MRVFNTENWDVLDWKFEDLCQVFSHIIVS